MAPNSTDTPRIYPSTSFTLNNATSDGIVKRDGSAGIYIDSESVELGKCMKGVDTQKATKEGGESMEERDSGATGRTVGAGWSLNICKKNKS